MDFWTYEREQWNNAAETVCGVDEAGAGPLMGPVYAAAVILPRELDIPGLNDSKKLTEKKREALYEIITAQAAAWSVARVEAAEIDKMDILNARMLAMQKALDGLPLRPDLALIDGNRDHGSRYAIEIPHRLIVGGDGENTWFYFLWYGLGRSWIEGLRTDSLYLFNWQLFGQPIRVSQALSVVMVVVAAFMLFYNIKIKKRSPESLWVNQVAAEKARATAAAAEDAVLVETLMNEEPTQGEAADPVETEAVAADAPAAEAENAEAAPADAEETSEELPHGDEN